MTKRFVLGCCLLGTCALAAPEPATAQESTSQASAARESTAATKTEEKDPSDQSAYHNEACRGQVVWLAAVLKKRFGISTVPEVAEHALAIETTDGEVLPLVENIRGRAFRKDERLRDKDLEIWVRRYDKQPLVQVLRVFELQEGQRFELDYWCDVCAIPMYETGLCSCCQDHNRLRKRLLSDEDELNNAALDDSALDAAVEANP